MRDFQTRSSIDAVADATTRESAEGAGDREELGEQERIRYRGERTEHSIHRTFAAECLKFSVERWAVANVDDASDGEPSPAQSVDAELPSATMITGDRGSSDTEHGSEVARHCHAAGNPGGFRREGALAYDDEVVAEQSPAGRDRGKREGRLALSRRAEHHVRVSILCDEPGCMQHISIVVREKVCHGEVEQLLPHAVEVFAVSADPCTVWRRPRSGGHIVEVHDQIAALMPHAEALVDVTGLSARACRTSPLVPDRQGGRPGVGCQTVQEPCDRRGSVLIDGNEGGRNICDVDDAREARYHAQRPYLT